MKSCSVKILIAIATLFNICVGCSSSGGSSAGSSSPPPPTTLEYEGESEPISITEQNAHEIAYLFPEHLYIIEYVESMWFDMRPLKEIGQERIDEIVQGAEGGSFRVKAYNQNQTLYLEVVFSDFREFGLTLNGQIDQSATLTQLEEASVDGGSPISGKLQLHNVSAAGAGGKFTLNGAMVRQGLSESWELNAVARDDTTNEMLKLERYRYTRSGDHQVRLFEFSGTAFHSELGKISVETLSPFEDLGISALRDGNETWSAGSGELLIKGDIGLKFISRNDRFVSLLMDKDKDGTFESGKRLEWREVSGLPAEFGKEFLPEIGAVAEKFIPESTGGRVDINAILSHARGDGFLTYSWKKVYTPNNSLAPASATGPYLSFNSDQVGNYIYDLTVRQGDLEDSERIEFQIFRHPYSDAEVINSIDYGSNIVVVQDSSDGSSQKLYVDSIFNGPEVPEALNWTILPNDILDTDVEIRGDEALVATVEAGETIRGRYSVGLAVASVGQGDLNFDFWPQKFSQADIYIYPFTEPKQTLHKDVNGDQILDLVFVSYWDAGIKIVNSIGTEAQSETDFTHQNASELQVSEDDRPSGLTFFEHSLFREGLDVSVLELSGSELKRMQLERFIHNCQAFKSHYPLILGDITRDEFLDVISFSPCKDELYYWPRTNSDQFGSPQLLYQILNSDSTVRKIKVAVSNAGNQDSIYVLLDTGLLFIEHNGVSYQQKKKAMAAGYFPLDLLQVNDSHGGSEMFLLTKQELSSNIYLQRIEVVQDGITFGPPILIDQSIEFYDGSTSGVVGDLNADGLDDLIVLHSRKVFWVPNYKASNTAHYVICCSGLYDENMSSVSLVDVNNDEKLEILVGRHAFFSSFH